MMKNILNLYYFCLYLNKRPKNDLVLCRFVIYTPQGLKSYQSCRRSLQVNSFRVLADSEWTQFVRHTERHDRETDRQTNRQRDRQTDRQTDRVNCRVT